MAYDDFLTIWLPIYHLGNMEEIREMARDYPNQVERFYREFQEVQE